MTPNLLDELEAEAKWLRKAAAEIANAGHTGWGNTCLQAAECIERNAPALADMAKRLEAAERDAERYQRLRDADPDSGAPYIARERQDSWGNWKTEWLGGLNADLTIDATQEGAG
jgi:hypothetical protein